jgi:hypothetical protein
MARHSSSPFKSLSCFHVPGVDRIDEVFEKITEKLGSSIAHTFGQRRVLSETYALIGWKLGLPYMKQIADYQYVRGINLLSPHGFYYSIEDYRKSECPPSEFFQNPWWKFFAPFADYIRRLSFILSQGTHVAPIALYYPMISAWATITPESPTAFDGGAWHHDQIRDQHLPVHQTDRTMFHLALELLKNQLDFDFVDDAVLESMSVQETTLRTAHESYRCVIVPHCYAMPARTVERLIEFADAGGVVIFAGRYPDHIIGTDNSQAILQRLRSHSKIHFIPEGLGPVLETLERTVEPDFSITPSTPHVTYHRRYIGPEELYFVVNESAQPINVQARFTAQGEPHVWSPETGKATQLRTLTIMDGYVWLDLHFEPFESKVIVFGSSLPKDVLEEHNGAFEQRIVLYIPSWNVTLNGKSFSANELKTWSRWGEPFYSGEAEYSCEFEWNEADESEVFLDLGRVEQHAIVWFNGVELGIRVWQPYRFEVGKTLKQGKNELRVVVANVNANAFERKELPAGLLGPISLLLLNR